MKAELLYVVVPFNNPMRWASRLKNHLRCENELIASGVQLVTVECASGDRDFELPQREGVIRVRVRTPHVLWQKENLGKIGFAAIPQWKYGALIDGDFLFVNPDWAIETVHALQLRRVVQISSHLVFLGPRGEHVSRGESIVSIYHRLGWHKCHNTPPSGPWGYPGGAWAFRRDVYEALHGLLDICILGSADYHMARGLLSLPDSKKQAEASSAGYLNHIDSWQKRAYANVHGDVGLVTGTALHLWHGPYKARSYESRPSILMRNKYDPDTDVVRHATGLITLAGNKPQLRDELHAYFNSRNEDSNCLD